MVLSWRIKNDLEVCKMILEMLRSMTYVAIVLPAPAETH